MKKLLALIIALVLLAASFAVVSYSDFGDFGGDADFGDFGGGDYGGDYDDDYGGSSYGGLIFGFGSDAASTVITLVIVVVLIIVFTAVKKSGNRGGQRINVGDRSAPASSLTPMSAYLNIDPYFNEADLREKVSNLYVQMQNCWTAKDISPLRPYFTDALFTQFERQLAQKKAQGLTNYIDRISVQSVDLRGFRQDGANDHIIVRLQTRIVDYTVNDRTGQVVSGSKDREKFMTYEWDLSRTTGLTSLKKDGVGRVECPSCGAPLDINVSARCEYCGSVVNSSAHDWAICNITAISQQTL